MNRHILFLIGLILSLFFCFVPGAATPPVLNNPASPHYEVNTQVVDSLGNPEAYATWTLISMPDSVPIATSVADENGYITYRLPKAGDYRLHIIGLSGLTTTTKVHVDDANPVARLDTLMLVAGGKELEEVVVIAQRPLVTREIDRIGYDVKADPDALALPLSEILQKVPLVSVDGEGNILVNGSTNFRIYKNGRPNSAYSRNAKELFKAIPASSIKKIEVITDPGAREDAEGVGAILNIVTDNTGSLQGVTGSISASVSHHNWIPQPSGWITSQIDKVTFSVYGGYWSNNSAQRRNSQQTDGTYTQTGNRLSQHRNNTSHGEGGWGSIEMSWEPDTLNLVTLEAGLYPYSQNSGSKLFTAMTDADGNPLYSYSAVSDRENNTYRNLWMDGRLNYQRNTRRKNEHITFSYQLEGCNSTERSLTDYYDLNNVSFPYTATQSKTRLNMQYHTFQLDWTRPYGDKHTVDIGGKYILRLNHARDTHTYTDAPDMDTYDNYKHRSDIGAAYVDYRGKFGAWSVRAGFRYEYSYFKSTFLAGDGNNYSTHLHDYVPQASVQWCPNDASTLKLSYTRRIERPSIWYLNPAVTEGPMSTSQGNPNLHSAGNNSINFNYSLIKSRFNADISFSYSWTEDGIGSVTTVVNDHNYYTYANVMQFYRYSINANLQWTITEKTSLNFYTYFNYLSWRDPVKNIRNKGPQFYARLQATQHLPWKLRLTASFSIRGGKVNGLYQNTNQWFPVSYTYLSLQRNFLKDDRLTTRIGINNPFGPYKGTYKYYTVNSGYDSRTIYTYPNNFSFFLSVSYRFGSLKASVKKTAASISNDDVQRK